MNSREREKFNGRVLTNTMGKGDLDRLDKILNQPIVLDKEVEEQLEYMYTIGCMGSMELNDIAYNTIKSHITAQASEIERLNNKIWNIQELLDLTPKDIRDVATYTYEELNQIIGGTK